MEMIRLGPGQVVARAAVLALGLAYTVVPILWILSMSVRPPGQVSYPLPVLPSGFSMDAFHDVLFGGGFGARSGIGFRPYLNAGIYGVSSGLITATVSLMGGYALARYDMRAGRALLLVFLGLNFLPGAARLVPLFILFVATGLYNTWIGVILAYVAGSIPIGIWLMAGTIRQIPYRLEQAAQVDGATALTIARRIILPLAMPGVFVVGVLAFVDGWNAFSLPLILMQQPEALPYTVALQKYAEGDFGVIWTNLAAGAVLGALPALVAFAALRRRLLHGTGLSGALAG